jgi:dienelactone hydrolase
VEESDCFVPRSGRALVYPIYKGMYERHLPFPASPNELRDRMIHWCRDLGRTVDYLESRVDVDARKLAFYGFSMGAWFGPIFNALEPRFSASALLGAGLCVLHSVQHVALPLNAANFAPRSKVSTIMINGRDDWCGRFTRRSALCSICSERVKMRSGTSCSREDTFPPTGPE